MSLASGALISGSNPQVACCCLPTACEGLSNTAPNTKTDTNINLDTTTNSDTNANKDIDKKTTHFQVTLSVFIANTNSRDLSPIACEGPVEALTLKQENLECVNI